MDFRKLFLGAVGGAGVGAGVMYLFDRQVGKRRRAGIRDKAVHGVHVAGDASGKVSRDIRNRARGMVLGMKGMFSREAVTDRVLEERVRSNLGYVVSHPGSIHVKAEEGSVKLTGVVLAAELDDLLKEVKSVRGVRDVSHDLEVHQEPGNVPGLQGEGSRSLAGGRFELMQVNWSPAARAFTGVAGAALIASGFASGLLRRRIAGMVAAAAGLPLLVRAAANMPLSRIVGAAGRRGVDIQKTINIDAPVEKVFGTLSRIEELPNFTTHVRRVQKLDTDRYRWTISGPAGISVDWESVRLSTIPNRQLAWKTVPESRMKHEGVAEFRTNPDGSTAVNIRLTYNPVIGGIGHALLKTLGADPKTLLDEELVRVKTFIEKGKPPRDAAARTIRKSESEIGREPEDRPETT
jgi:uncharacterized membrane protein